MKIREIVITGKDTAILRDGEFDETELAPDELLVETECSFISTGTELSIFTGRDPQTRQTGGWCEWPWKAGYANVGRVKAAGSATRRAKVGQRVFSFGKHVSAHRYPESRMILTVPDGIEPGLAAASRMAGVAMTALILVEIKGNPWVAVYGLGMVGNLAAQTFVARGCRVIGVDPVQHRRDLAKTCGVQHVVGGTAEEARKAIRDLTGGALCAITIDAVGHSAVVADAIKSTATFGQHVILGTPRVPVETNVTEMLRDIHSRFIVMRCALEWCLPEYPQTGSTWSLLSKQETIFDWMSRGELKIEPLISHRLPPTRIQEAYEGLERTPETFTGVVLDWGR